MSGINKQSEEQASLQIGPTDQGMVRIFVATDTLDIPMDFTADEAREIAEELVAAAEMVKKSR
ncbi:MAG: hypothetical protein EP340_07060 [Alphaproteobacteria bacterium]|nr:MAG: hypothetical protein EP340_07060 [Alphaproteobacteria bacterium]